MAQAVHSGDVVRFNDVLKVSQAKFQQDKTYTLIIRLRHNVIKTGIRMISLSYSRISLADIAEKLSLESTQDAEYIVAKAIRDGVIEAVINHEEGYVQSRVSGECVCVCVCTCVVCVCVWCVCVCVCLCLCACMLW